MKKATRDRVVDEACPRCGSPAGERCHNYRGDNKAPCRIDAHGRDQPEAGPAIRQGALFHGGGDE